MAETSTEVQQIKPQSRHLPIWVSILAFLALFGFLTLLALGLKRTSAGPIAIGQRVPPITLTTFDEKSLVTTGMTGKVIVINFWASWCQPCASEAGFLEQAWKHYEPGGQVVFLGIDYVDTEPEALSYLDQYNVTYANGPDLGTRIAQMFHIQGVPETYIIDQNGRLVYKEIGPFPSEDSITSVIDALLK